MNLKIIKNLLFLLFNSKNSFVSLNFSVFDLPASYFREKCMMSVQQCHISGITKQKIATKVKPSGGRAPEADWPRSPLHDSGKTGAGTLQKAQ